MKRISGIGVAFTLMAGYCSLLIAETQLTPVEVITDMEQKGRIALEDQQYDKAYELFSKGSEAATDPDLKARFDFGRAVTLQQMAGAPKLERAARLYLDYLDDYPQSSAAKNNLAKVFESLGDLSSQKPSSEQDNEYYDIAVGFYEEAIKANDSNKGLYLKNYADFLERTGDWDNAKLNYAIMIRGYPISPRLQQTLRSQNCLPLTCPHEWYHSLS